MNKIEPSGPSILNECMNLFMNYLKENELKKNEEDEEEKNK